MSEPNNLIRQLEQLRDRDDRGSLASLRRGLGQEPGTVAEVSRIVEPMLEVTDSCLVSHTLYIIAPLFAFHPEKGGSGNMGDHFRALVKEGDDPPPNVERRFVALLSSEPADLPDALRQAVSLLKAKAVRVDWRQLFRDVHEWLRSDSASDQARQQVRLRWSKQFWRVRSTRQIQGTSRIEAESENQTNEGE